jgi:hypothetical protein
MTDDILTAAAPAPAAATPVAEEMKSTAVPSLMKPVEAKPAQEAPAAAQEGGEGEAEHEEEASAASEGTDAPDGTRKNKGVGKRINELTREKYEAIRKAEALERRVAELEKGGTQQSAPEQTGRPKLEDYDFDNDKYLEALADWKVDQKLSAKSNNDRREVQAQAVEKRIATYAEKNPEAWHEAVTAPVNYTEPMLAALAESELMPEIGVYLAQHLDEADAISKMSPAGQIKAIARIEASLAPQGAASSTQTARVEPPKKLTTTPPPAKTLQGGAPAVKSIDDMTTAERIAHWRAEKANR